MLQNDVGDGVFGLVADRKMSFQIFVFEQDFQLTVEIEYRLAQIVMGDKDAAKASLAKAREAFAAEPPALDVLRQAETDNGLGS